MRFKKLSEERETRLHGLVGAIQGQGPWAIVAATERATGKERAVICLMKPDGRMAPVAVLIDDVSEFDPEVPEVPEVAPEVFRGPGQRIPATRVGGPSSVPNTLREMLEQARDESQN